MNDNTNIPPVLFLGDHFGYASGVAHGGTAYFLNVIPALVDAGIDISACFLREAHPAAAGLRDSGVEPVFLGAHAMNPFVVFQVAKIAKARRARIIHAGGIKATLVARVVARMVGIEAVVHVHDLTYPSKPISALHRVSARPSDTGVCVSGAARDIIVNGYHVRPERTRVIHNAITLARVKNVAADARATRRAELGLAEDARVLTLIGRIHPVKGHSGMLRTMPAVLESCPNAVLVCVGDGPDRGDCEALAEQIGVRSNVHFLGQRNDVPEWLAASDLVVIPSLSEGLPFAAIEALAAGKPIVAHRVGGLTEVIDDGVDGALVELGDRRAFAQAIVTLLTDASLMERYSRAASVEAERFSLERHVDSLKRLYRDIDRGTVA